MPEVHFILLGKWQEGEYSYGRRLMLSKPSNVEFIQGTLKDNLDRLRESSVYVYTGRDRAIMLTVAEAISAGCYPIVAEDSSALDVTSIAHIGQAYDSIDQLVALLEFWLDNPPDPRVTSMHAKPFRPENFEKWVQKIAA